MPGIVRVVVLQMAAAPGTSPATSPPSSSSLASTGAADLVVTPELVTTGYDLELLGEAGPDLAEPLDGASVAPSRKSPPTPAPRSSSGSRARRDAVYDSAVTISPDGAVTSYRKSHLYPPEVAVFAAGCRSTPSSRLPG